MKSRVTPVKPDSTDPALTQREQHDLPDYVRDARRRLIGKVGSPKKLDVSLVAVRRLCLATMMSPDSQHLSEQDGSTRRDLVPPTFFCPDPLIAAQEMNLYVPSILDRHIDGGSEWEFHSPVRLGDALVLIARIGDVAFNITKAGKHQVTVVIEVFAWNQHGESAGIARGNIINYGSRAQ